MYFITVQLNFLADDTNIFFAQEMTQLNSAKAGKQLG